MMFDEDIFLTDKYKKPKVINLSFERYSGYDEFLEMPDKSGLYVVYAYAYDSQSNNIDTARKRLLYIGQSINIGGRLENHEKYEMWRQDLKKDEKLCYSCCLVHQPDKSRAENALVYKVKPRFNDDLKYHFNYPRTKIIIESDFVPHNIPKSFEVERTE